MSYEDFIATLSKDTRDRIKKASEINTGKIPLASLGLTNSLNGGFGKGRQSLIWGNKSCGKSSMLLQSISLAQKRGEMCVWIDAENSYDKEWAARLGVDNDQLILAPAKSIDEVTAIGCDFMKSKADFVVIDSISALLPSTYFEKNDDLKEGLEGTKQIGTTSKELGVMVNKFNFINQSTALVMISQLRNKINTYGAVGAATGGEAMKFFSSTVVKLWSSASEREQITANITRNDKIVSIPVGRTVNYTVEYNKIGPPNQTGEYDFYYGGPTVGIDEIGEIVDLSEKAGYVHKGGAWYAFGDDKFQGKPKLVQWLKDNPVKIDELRTLLNG